MTTFLRKIVRSGSLVLTDFTSSLIGAIWLSYWLWWIRTVNCLLITQNPSSPQLLSPSTWTTIWWNIVVAYRVFDLLMEDGFSHSEQFHKSLTDYPIKRTSFFNYERHRKYVLSSKWGIETNTMVDKLFSATNNYSWIPSCTLVSFEKNIRLLLLPQYSPELNPTELWFVFLKNRLRVQHRDVSLEDIVFHLAKLTRRMTRKPSPWPDVPFVYQVDWTYDELMMGRDNRNDPLWRDFWINFSDSRGVLKK